MAIIRFGIVGTGGIASKFARALGMTEGVCAGGVSSRSAERGAVFAHDFDVERVYQGEDEMLLSPDIDIVYVATPHPLHFECAMKALRAGKHVLCEKPITTRVQEAEALFSEAKQRGLLLIEGMWSRYLPNAQLARQWIEQGRIGRLRFIDGMFSFAVDPRAPKPRLVEPRLGGGAMFDVGVYTIEMASFYAGADPGSWSGFHVPYCPGTDGLSILALQYPNEVLATLRMGIQCDAPSDMTVYGDKGRIVLPRFYLGNEARLYEGDVLAETAQDSFLLPQGFVWQIAAVRDLLLAGKTESDVVPPATSIHCVRIMESMMHQFFPDMY